MFFCYLGNAGELSQLTAETRRQQLNMWGAEMLLLKDSALHHLLLTSTACYNLTVFASLSLVTEIVPKHEHTDTQNFVQTCQFTT